MGYFVECVKDIKNQIPKEWKYTGYANDMCPSYSFNNLKVFIDHLDPKKREDQTLSRFSITDDNEESDNYQMIIFETEKFEEVLKYMEFIFEKSDDPQMYDDQYTLRADKNISIQVSDEFICVNKWVEEEETMYHLGSFKTLMDAMDQALATREPVLYKNLTFKENK